MFERESEIRKLVLSKFGAKIARNGLSFDDVYQEILKGLLIRSKGVGAWNASRGKFSTYVVMVANNVFLNLLEKKKKEFLFEEVPLEMGTVCDDYDLVVSDFKSKLSPKGALVLDKLLSGTRNVAQIAGELGFTRWEAEKVMGEIRDLSRDLRP